MKTAFRNSITITLIIVSVTYLGLFSFLLLQHGKVQSMSSDRMHPSIPKGSLLIYDWIEPRSLQIGDIILFTNQDKSYSVGRIAGVIYENDEPIFRTKSAANTWLDFGFKKESEIHGVVTRQIPHIGFIADYSRSFGGKLLLVTPLIIMLSILFFINRHAMFNKL